MVLPELPLHRRGSGPDRRAGDEGSCVVKIDDLKGLARQVAKVARVDVQSVCFGFGADPLWAHETWVWSCSVTIERKKGNGHTYTSHATGTGETPREAATAALQDVSDWRYADEVLNEHEKKMRAQKKQRTT